MTTFKIIRSIDVPAKQTWNILSDFTHAPTPKFAVEVEEKGDPKLNGVGTIRIITVGKDRFHERLESVNPPHSLTYRLLSGAPVKDYLGKIDIKAQGKTTLITWKVKLIPKIIGTGWIIAMVTKNTINRIITDIEAEYR